MQDSMSVPLTSIPHISQPVQLLLKLLQLKVSSNFGVIVLFSKVIIVASVSGSGTTQHAGEDYTLTCTVSGGETTATTTYQWCRDNSPLSGETSATLSFTPLRRTTPSSNGQYVCEAMSCGRTVRSEGFTITVMGKFDHSWTL